LKRARALDACSTLERREAAFVRAELAIAAACEGADREDERRMTAARSSVARLPQWTAAACAFIDMRRLRSKIEKTRRADESERARQRARAHDAQRRHWAALVRGLQRRESRRCTQSEDTSCPA
jgi:hypothetical protein